jgi:hypothetical protein
MDDIDLRLMRTEKPKEARKMFECLKRWFCKGKRGLMEADLKEAIRLSDMARAKDIKDWPHPIDDLFNRIQLPKEDTVTCDTCKCILHKKDAQEVEFTFFGTVCVQKQNTFYCQAHKKPYEIQTREAGFDKKNKYYAKVEVDAHGIPVGFKPVKEKK